MLVMADCPNFI